jgi:hypothetical protein
MTNFIRTSRMTNFHRNTNSDKRSTRVTQHAKAPSAGSTQATGSSRSLLRRALATRGALGGSEGSGAPASRRARSTLAALALAIAAFALTAAPAGAAPTVKTPVVSDVSYTTAHVASEVDPQGQFVFVSYAFQFSTNGIDWTNNATGFFSQKEILNAELTGLDAGTHYFVRLAATQGFGGVTNPPEVVSAGPNPEFTTLTADPPTIPGAVAASDVFSTSATATAEVRRPANSDDVECHFEYVSDEDFTATGFAGATARDCAQGPIGAADAETDKEVTAALGCPNPVLEGPQGRCLKPGTAYHLRLVAENAAPGVVTKDAATTFTTAPEVTSAPTVIATEDATDVGKRTAKASGEIQRPAGDDPALDTSCRFEYVTDADFTATGFAGAGIANCVEAPPEDPLTSTETDPTAVSAELSGLTPDTTYHFRLTAENGAGTDTKEAAGTFTTLPVIPPTLTLDPITDIGYSGAHWTGTADPGNQGMAWGVQWAIDPDTEGWTGSAAEEAALDEGSVSGTVPSLNGNRADLKPGTTYKVRLEGFDLEEFSTHYSETREFTTKGTSTPPSATLDPITVFTGNTAHFSGAVGANAPGGPLDEEGKAAYRTDWQIECVPECKDVNGNPIAGTVEAEEGAEAISADAKRLEPNTDYEVKLVARNVLGTVESVRTFHTSKAPPTVKQAPGAADGKAGYTLQGVVNPNNETVTGCEFKWGPNAPAYAFSAPCSPLPGGGSKPVTVEAPLTGLNPGVTYHALLVVRYGAGLEVDSGDDQEFVATLDPADNCPNEQRRQENNSLALPECRAYEMVTPPGKEGFGAGLNSFDGGERVMYQTKAGNIAKSGQNGLTRNFYVTARSATGWETIPNLNGPTGSIYDTPNNFDPFGTSGGAAPVQYSSDLLSSVWFANKAGSAEENYALRRPDGSFTLLAKREVNGGGMGIYQIGGWSDDLSHLFITSNVLPTGFAPTNWGPGVYEFLGTGNEQPPRRVDVDNSGNPITTCTWGSGSSAQLEFNSGDGRVAVSRVAGGCGGANPPATGLWARIDGTTSVNIAASQCDRTVGDPGGACNDPIGSGACINGPSSEEGPGCRGLQFRGAASDGSRVFFSTAQQLVDADTDEANDLYACDIPSGTPAPAGDANPCSVLRQVSAGDLTGAAVESVGTTSANGATVLFTAKGVVADNEDALGAEALAGDHNLYAWRTDAAHPAGQTTFVGRLESNSVGGQSTPDGRYLVFTTASQLVDTDTDNAHDLYRYDVEAGDLSRVSTNVLGVAGNGNGFDAVISSLRDSQNRLVQGSHPSVSDDGQKIVFTTTEALSPADGNGEPDLYLWTPARVSLISTGAVGAGIGGEGGEPLGYVSPSGQDIYFNTPGALSPTDGDDNVDVYDARIAGGFSFASKPSCAGEACQTATTPTLVKRAPSSSQPGPGNPSPPKPCPKGKVRKHGKCVKKASKKHHKSSHKKSKRASSNRGGVK